MPHHEHVAELREVRFWRFEEDFGISLLIVTPGVDPASEVAGGDADDARALRDDACLLLDSCLPAEVLHTVWLAATAGREDPGSDIRDLLRRIVELCEDRISREAIECRACDPLPATTAATVAVDEGAMRNAVCAEVRALGAQLTGPDVVSALERVAVEVDADLGFRLFLRVVKATAVRIALEQCDRYEAIGEKFGYPGRLVYDGLDVCWPRFDDVSLRRRFAWDFGFSSLAGRFHGDLWQHSHTVDEGIRGAAADYAGLVPGTAAYTLLEDTLRLSRSSMSDDALTVLWQGATVFGYDPRGEGAGPRQWLARVSEVCAERLREVDSGFMIGAPAPIASERLNPVLRELREIAPSLTRAVHDSPWFGVDDSPWFSFSGMVVPVLEQVVTEVDPDLGFRLLLSFVKGYSVPVTEEQYSRYTALGSEFGYGGSHVADLAAPCEGR
ncbi:hypothetical protein ACWCQK_35545 [Streptomyces sp. NPDC002306]